MNIATVMIAAELIRKFTPVCIEVGRKALNRASHKYPNRPIGIATRCANKGGEIEFHPLTTGTMIKVAFDAPIDSYDIGNPVYLGDGAATLYSPSGCGEQIFELGILCDVDKEPQSLSRVGTIVITSRFVAQIA